LESRAAARATQLQINMEAQEQLAAQLRNLTPLEKEYLDAFGHPAVPSYTAKLIINAIIQKSQLFGLQLPTPEEVRHKRQVTEEVAKIEQERAALGDTVFLDKNTVREMAENRLRRERRGRAQTRSMITEEAAD
jgi:hypothetical protein